MTVGRKLSMFFFCQVKTFVSWPGRIFFKYTKNKMRRDRTYWLYLSLMRPGMHSSNNWGIFNGSNDRELSRIPALYPCYWKKLSQKHGSPALLNKVWFTYSLLIEVRWSLTLCSFMNTETYAMKTLY